MYVDLRGAHVHVPQQFLYGADIVAGFQQMDGERMPQGVAGRRLDDAACCRADCTARCRISSETWCRPGRPLRGSCNRRTDGNRYCHPGSMSALGYLRANACGKKTRPAPAARSAACTNSARSRCRGSASRRLCGNGTRRSLPPLPSRTTISPRAASTSLMRRRRHSINRIPLPYSRLAISQHGPSSTASKRATSSRESTTGIRLGRLARTRFSIHGNSMRSTSR